MKIKLHSKSKNLTPNKKANSSLERRKCKNKSIIIFNPTSLLTMPTFQAHPKYISISNLHSQPKKRKAKKVPKQQPEFIKQFEEITEIYKKSRQVENQEQIDLLCTEQNIESGCNNREKNKFKSYYSISNRYSEHSSALLPSIAEKDVEQQKEDDLLMTTKKALHRSPLTTATQNRTKNVKSAHDKYINQFQIKNKSTSRQKKMTIDVQRVIISRSKVKSTNSQRKGQKNRVR